MKKLLAFSSIFLSLFLAENQASKAAKDLTPYQTVVLASGVNFCSAEYGLISDKEAYQYVLDWVKDDHGLEAYQVYNLMQRKSWGKDTDKFIDNAGGCKGIVTAIQDELKRKPSGFKALTNGKKDYEYFYKIDF